MQLSDEELIQKARVAQSHAYAPYSQFAVGAALLTEDGQVFTGCNVENATFGATVCAERTAVFSAVCHGARRFVKIAIVTDNKEPVMPCGICRSVLFEFAPNLEVIAVGSSGQVEKISLSQLYPKGFRLEVENEK
ncbi:MAG: cytidine deaminase [Candidatus Thorarchaeota archaeon]